MGRPRKDRLVAFNPTISYFKPRGIPMVDLCEVGITVDEREALRLADLDGLSHEASGQCMGVSRATFGRILHRARQTVADALINGKAIKIDGGNYKMIDEIRRFACRKCEHQWDEPLGTGRPEGCPACGQEDFCRIIED
ncbi:MAG: hypothetical protein CR984_05075 [Proteobacteria bacterium]|nr:MAG: hypothetical protein CR984_05075 [Pseudomonadota bacterium]PIE67282.1 MAG: hypothetical protein CSA23_04805 [Deltaproteobacteria bacterium]